LSPIEADDRFDGSLGPRIEEVQVPGEVGRISAKHPNAMGQKGIDQSAKGNARIHEGNI